MLSPLIRKAAADAGFDLELGVNDGWARLAISGTLGSVWVKPVPSAVLLALPALGWLNEPGQAEAASDAMPSDAKAVVRASSPAELYDILRRVRVLLVQSPPRLQERLQARLESLGSTETEAVVRQRVGQDLFREALLDYWEGRCAVTGVDVPELLRASHAKPWKDATDAERLDVYNGLLLAAHLDALFDTGLLTFDEAGHGILSERLSAAAVRALGLGGSQLRLSHVSPGHAQFLAYHRAHVFRPV